MLGERKVFKSSQLQASCPQPMRGSVLGPNPQPSADLPPPTAHPMCGRPSVYFQGPGLCLPSRGPRR